MKHVKYLLTILLPLLLIVNKEVIILAMDIGFSTESLSANDQNTFLSNINFSILYKEPPKKAIECFDVNEDRLIAIGSSATDRKTISIYTDNGVFQYGYEFNCSGNFGIEWNESELIIYFVRSDIAATIDSKGTIGNIVKIKNTIDNNSYWNHSVFSTKRNVGDTEYIIKNDMGFFNIFASSYTQLIATETNGGQTIIYDVNTKQLSNMLVTFIGIFIFVFIIVLLIVWQFIKMKRSITLNTKK